MADRLSLAERGEYALDASNSWSIDEVLGGKTINWRPIGQELSLGLINETAWVKLPIPRQTDKSEDTHVFHFSNHLTNRAWIYLVKDNRLIDGALLGDHVKLASRHIKVAEIMWQLPKDWQNASHIYVQISSDSFLQSHFEIKSAATTIEDQTTRYWLLGLFYGAIGIMALYNLFIYFQVRDIRYLYYTCYVFCAGMFCAIMDGLPYYHLSDMYADRIDRTLIYFVVFTNVFGILYVAKFLEIREPLILRALRTLIYTFLVAIIIEYFERGHLSAAYIIDRKSVV